MVPGKKASEKYSALLIASVFMLYLCSVAAAGTVIIKPGQFDHFTLQMPDKAVAGENFVIKISAYDANKNLITNFSETGKEFRVDMSGLAISQPSVLGASSFSGGVANIVINDKKAEKVTFSIREAGGSVPVISREILVLPNKLDHFVIQSPVSVTAGASFDVKIVAKDIFDNTVQDLDVGRNMTVTSSGTSSVKLQGGAIDFKNGLASAAFISEKAGEVVINLQDTASGSRGTTQTIQIAPAGLAYFKLQAPKSGIAGEPFELLIAAYDMYDNVFTNYSSNGGGVKLSSTGSSKIEPAIVNSSMFRNGQALVKVVYERAEEFQIVARELNREQSGKTSEILIANSLADHFVVVTPDSALSGQKFRIRVEAYDRYNNPVRDFNLAGFDVLLSTSGNGSLSPSRLAPPDFTSGIAFADVVYDKAESFQISARMSSDRSTGRIAVSDHEVKRDVSHVSIKTDRKEVRKPAETEPTTVTKKMKESPKSIPDKPVKTAKKQTPKSEPKKEIVKSEQEVKKPKPKKEEPKKEAVKKETPITPVREPEKRAIEPQQNVTRKETPASKPVEKKIEKPVAVETKKPVVELAKKEDNKTDKAQYNISKVSIIEAKNKAMLVINVTNPNGNLDYGDEIESKHGKEWLKLRVKPATNSTEKIFKFKSGYIGEVRIEEDKTSGQNLVNIYIELLPAGVTYDIARIKNTLVLTFSNP